MYRPAHFDLQDPDVLWEVMASSSFVTLVSAAPHPAGEANANVQAPLASHLPVVLDRARGARGVLFGHLAKANPHARLLDQSEALVVFSGPHAYVSPRWYASEHQVPTWNYVAVHAYGTPRILEDPKDAAMVLERLTSQYEPAEGWSPAALPPERYAALLRGIVAFELPITRLEGKLKLSQNRSAEDQRGAERVLSESSDETERQLAAWMARVNGAGTG